MSALPQTDPRIAAFHAANQARSRFAANQTAAQVLWALGVLGDQVPEHLRAAGRLRIEHPEASLTELGCLACPPVSKDAMSGRLRRLIQAGQANKPCPRDNGTH